MHRRINKIRRGTAWGIVLFAACSGATAIDAAAIEPTWDGIHDVADTHVYLRSDSVTVQTGQGWSGGRLGNYYWQQPVYQFPLEGLAATSYALELTLAAKPTDCRIPRPYCEPATAHEIQIRVRPDDGRVSFADFLTLSPQLDEQSMNQGYLAFWQVWEERWANEPSQVPAAQPWDAGAVGYKIADVDAGSVLRSTAGFSDRLNELIEAGHSHVIVTLEMTHGPGDALFATLEHDLYPSARIVSVPEPGGGLIVWALGAMAAVRRGSKNRLNG